MVSFLEEGRAELFRPSRPDSIETILTASWGRVGTFDCSGLLGRTPLRRLRSRAASPEVRTLFRPSRPDSIETNSGC